jgi:hypothetical protein
MLTANSFDVIPLSLKGADFSRFHRNFPVLLELLSRHVRLQWRYTIDVGLLTQGGGLLHFAASAVAKY